jgi:hypothetical protein
MKFKASPEQILELKRLAINASSPMGLGFLHYENKEYTADEVKELTEPVPYLDYFNGRMVKLWVNAVRKFPGYFEAPDQDPNPGYQSWVRKYPTWGALLTAAGIELTE